VLFDFITIRGRDFTQALKVSELRFCIPTLVKCYPGHTLFTHPELSVVGCRISTIIVYEY